MSFHVPTTLLAFLIACADAGTTRAADEAIVYRIEHHIELDGKSEIGETACGHAPQCDLAVGRLDMRVAIDWRAPWGPQIIVHGTDLHFADKGELVALLDIEPTRDPTCLPIFHGEGARQFGIARDLVLRRSTRAGWVCVMFKPDRSP